LNQATPVAAPTRILIVDDNPVDVQIVRYALQEETDWLTEIVVAMDGQEAIDYLLHKVASGEVRRPDLVILDLNLPKREGTEVLQVMNSTAALADVPVLILSCYPEDVIREKTLQANVAANAYMTKPSGIEEFAELGSKVRKCCATQERRLDGRTTAG
jgi:two-component system, chemotaxis family, response regulator Rcp1